MCSFTKGVFSKKAENRIYCGGVVVIIISYRLR